MHRTLRRQIERYIPDVETETLSIQKLLDAISVSYEDFDRDRELTARSLTISSRELSESVTLFREILNTIEEGVVVADSKGRVIHYNKRFVEICSLPPEVMNNRHLLLIFTHILDHTVDKIKSQNIFPASMDLIEETEDVLHFPESRVVEVRSRAQLVEGRNIGRMWTFRDVTARLASEDALKSKLVAFERLNAAMVDRELKMIELKEKIARLEGTKT